MGGVRTAVVGQQSEAAEVEQEREERTEKRKKRKKLFCLASPRRIHGAMTLLSTAQVCHPPSYRLASFSCSYLF
jgi:hypothetical protein